MMPSQVLNAILMGLEPFWKLRFAYFLVTSKHDIDRKVTFNEPFLDP